MKHNTSCHKSYFIELKKKKKGMSTKPFSSHLAFLLLLFLFLLEKCLLVLLNCLYRTAFTITSLCCCCCPG